MFHIFFQNLKKIQSPPILLGRWCRTEKNLNDIKLDLANIDHCGICISNKVNAKLKNVRENNYNLLESKPSQTFT